jgi:hypothetical protein
MACNPAMKYLMIGVAMVAIGGAAQAQYSDGSVDTPGYVGPMGPNVSKAFTGSPDGNNVQPGMDPGENAYGDSGMAPATAMAPPPAARRSQPGIISDPQQVRDCLCMQTSYEMLRSDVSAKQDVYAKDQGEKSSLEDQINTAKEGPMSPDKVEQIRQMSQQRISLLNKIDSTDLPQLQAATAKYNRAAGGYERMCGNKSYDGEVLARVKSGLTCQGG